MFRHSRDDALYIRKRISKTKQNKSSVVLDWATQPLESFAQLIPSPAPHGDIRVTLQDYLNPERFISNSYVVVDEELRPPRAEIKKPPTRADDGVLDDPET
ncbi:hypothetical protein F4861DRAFT_496361 [Xylaria intraflava]|nr:hypothetical protein F4861DRAFT_496361 [Xylaria intraflava]